MFTTIPNHVQQALARLVTQYQNSPNLQSLLSGIVTPCQDIENALVDMNNLRYLPDATGAQLDVIGVIVGLARTQGQSDASYILDLYGQIKVNTSEGQPEQAIQAFLLFTGAPYVLLYETHLASLFFNSIYTPSDQSAADMLIETMEEVTPAGVRVEGFVSFDPSEAFSYDGPLPGAGYGDAGDPTVGGKYGRGYQYIGGGFAYAGDDPTGLGYGSEVDPLVGGCYVGYP
jgi:hypothetical protein